MAFPLRMLLAQFGLAAYSAVAGFSVWVDECGWGEHRVPVGVEPDLPARSVHQSVVPATQQHKIIGTLLVVPSPHEQRRTL